MWTIVFIIYYVGCPLSITHGPQNHQITKPVPPFDEHASAMQSVSRMFIEFLICINIIFMWSQLFEEKQGPTNSCHIQHSKATPGNASHILMTVLLAQ